MQLDEFLDINDLTRDALIRPGEVYITGYGDPPEEEVEAAVEEAAELAVEAAEVKAGSGETQEPEPTPVPQVTPEVVAVTELERTGASICLTAFDDPNENGIMDSAEMLRPAVAFTISDSETVISNYVTDGSNEPFCIQGLDPGNYNVTRSHLANENLTTPGNQSISLGEGTSIDLEFGSNLLESDAAEIAADTAAPAEEGGVPNILIIASIVVGVLLFVAVVILLITRSRESAT
jgi:hypothetical protein